MKKFFVLLAVLLCILAFTSTSFATIVGTRHDLSASTTNNQLCVVCHTPHNGATDNDAPLWNHAVTAASFTMYTSATLDASMPTDGPMPDGISKLCLSCHDGVTGMLDYGSNSGTAPMIGNPAIGLDQLTNDHPVSFPFDSALATADGELHDPTGTPAVAELLFNGQVECASCHDVHDDTNSPFLRMSNANSDLCLTCHNK